MRALLPLQIACSAPLHPTVPLDLALDRVDDRATFAQLAGKLDTLTDSVARRGNRVELLVDGVTSFAHRLANARDADVILVKTFAFGDDDTGREVAAMLRERARAGALVIVQYDVTGSIHDGVDLGHLVTNRGEKPIVSSLREAGVQVIAVNAPAGRVDPDDIGGLVQRALAHPIDHIGKLVDSAHRLDFHDHEKYWITGHRHGDKLALTAIMGGMNIGSEYALGGTAKVDSVTGMHGWHDVDVEVTGPVVNDIVARFFDVMEAQLGHPRDAALRATWNPPQPAAGDASVRFVFNHPWFGNRHAIEELYGALIEAVPKRGAIRIETAYFAPSPLIRGALHAALGRGARLAVISNLETSDSPTVAEATRFAYRALLELDPETALFERIARPDLGEVMIHCKVASFGTLGPVIVGSANLDAQSGEHNSEGVLVIDDPQLRKQIDAMFDADYGADRATRITQATYEHDSSWAQVRQWAVWQLAWYWL
jgi:cardiolipin synthase